jgi:hypothetical protein
LGNILSNFLQTYLVTLEEISVGWNLVESSQTAVLCNNEFMLIFLPQARPDERMPKMVLSK